MDNVFAKVGGTKFCVCILVTVICTVLVWFGKIDGTQFVAAVGGVAGLFFGSNAVATFGNAKLEAARQAPKE